MKTTVFIVMFALLCSVVAFAQNKFTVAALTGYTMSAFEDQEDAAGTLKLAPSYIMPWGDLTLKLIMAVPN
ncbi:MAG: hypothetical protein MUC94_08170 [bacterium]|nr:hypothetical protein [bacterium]